MFVYLGMEAFGDGALVGAKLSGHPVSYVSYLLEGMGRDGVPSTV